MNLVPDINVFKFLSGPKWTSIVDELLFWIHVFYSTCIHQTWLEFSYNQYWQYFVSVWWLLEVSNTLHNCLFSDIKGIKMLTRTTIFTRRCEPHKKCMYFMFTKIYCKIQWILQKRYANGKYNYKYLLSSLSIICIYCFCQIPFS